VSENEEDIMRGGKESAEVKKRRDLRNRVRSVRREIRLLMTEEEREEERRIVRPKLRTIEELEQVLLILERELRRRRRDERRRVLRRRAIIQELRKDRQRLERERKRARDKDIEEKKRKRRRGEVPETEEEEDEGPPGGVEFVGPSDDGEREALVELERNTAELKDDVIRLNNQYFPDAKRDFDQKNRLNFDSNVFDQGNQFSNATLNRINVGLSPSVNIVHIINTLKREFNSTAKMKGHLDQRLVFLRNSAIDAQKRLQRQIDNHPDSSIKRDLLILRDVVNSAYQFQRTANRIIGVANELGFPVPGDVYRSVNFINWRIKHFMNYIKNKISVVALFVRLNSIKRLVDDLDRVITISRNAFQNVSGYALINGDFVSHMFESIIDPSRTRGFTDDMKVLEGKDFKASDRIEVKERKVVVADVDRDERERIFSARDPGDRVRNKILADTINEMVELKEERPRPPGGPPDQAPDQKGKKIHQLFINYSSIYSSIKNCFS
jgi:hypothetical protein